MNLLKYQHYQELGDRLKRLEKLAEGELLVPEQPSVVRLDGHGFSKFTKGFVKPLDEIFVGCMIQTIINNTAMVSIVSMYSHHFIM